MWKIPQKKANAQQVCAAVISVNIFLKQISDQLLLPIFA